MRCSRRPRARAVPQRKWTYAQLGLDLGRVAVTGRLAERGVSEARLEAEEGERDVDRGRTELLPRVHLVRHRLRSERRAERGRSASAGYTGEGAKSHCQVTSSHRRSKRPSLVDIK